MEDGTAIITQIANPAPSTDSIARVRQALKRLRERAMALEDYRKYYEGRQPMTYASDAYRSYFTRMVSSYVENLCPAIVDSLTDRLQITGTTLDSGKGVEQADAPIVDGEEETPEAAADPDPAPVGNTPEEKANARLWAIWRSNRMTRRAGRVHKDAVRFGDAYVIVWPDPVTSEPHIYPQDSSKVYVHYDPETEMVDWGAKFWWDKGNYARCTLYTAKTIERFKTSQPVKSPSRGLPGERAGWAVDPEEGHVENPHDKVPVFHFANDADVGEFGVSELRDVLPIQDALNKATADMLVSMEFNAYPQRWATGMQVENDPTTGKPKDDFKSGVDRVWRNSDPEGKFGQFEAGDLQQLIDVQNRFKSAAADVVGVPAHYMQMTPGSWPSGESLKTAEARFVAKVQDRQAAFGDVWAEVLQFCAMLEGWDPPGEIEVLWQDASPRSDADAIVVALGKKQVGVSNEQIQRELGYTEEEIAKMAVDAQVAADEEADRKVKMLNAQPFPEA